MYWVNDGKMDPGLATYSSVTACDFFPRSVRSSRSALEGAK